MTARRRPLADYGPVQLAGALGWSRGEVERGRDQGVLPAPDVAESEGLRARLGPPPIGARRAAEHIAEVTGLGVDWADVEALVERGLLVVWGYYKDWPLYDLADLDALVGDPTAVEALAELVAERQAWLVASLDRYQAAGRLGCRPGEVDAIAARREVTAGRYGRYAVADVDRLAADAELAEEVRRDRLVGPDQAAAHLGIRRTDFDYVVAAGWLAPVRHVDVRVGRRSWVPVALYAIGDIEAVPAAAGAAGVEWAAVLATRPGEPSVVRAVVAQACSRSDESQEGRTGPPARRGEINRARSEGAG